MLFNAFVSNLLSELPGKACIATSATPSKLTFMDSRNFEVGSLSVRELQPGLCEFLQDPQLAISSAGILLEENAHSKRQSLIAPQDLLATFGL